MDDITSSPHSIGQGYSNSPKTQKNFESVSLLDASKKTCSTETSSGTSQDKRNSLARRYRVFMSGAFLKIWTKECLLVLIATGLLIAIASILASYNHQPQPGWRLGLNLNTIIALLATILRSALLLVVEEVISQARWIWQRRPQSVRHVAYFDEASRGPWGSFMLGFRVPKLYTLSSLLSRKMSPAILGCIVTVLSLAIGSFTQQAIKLVDCDRRVLTTNASLPIAARNAMIPMSEVNSGMDLDTSLKGAIINAIAGSTSAQKSLLNNCITGNCTFEETNGVTHRTSGFCSKCLDTTSFIQETTAVTYSVNGTVVQTVPTLRLPNNMSIELLQSIAPSWPLVANVSDLQQNSSVIDWASSMFDAEMHHILDNRASVLGINILSTTKMNCTESSYNESSPFSPTSYDCKQNDGSSSPWNAVGATCVLYPCVKDLKATVRSGEFTEQVVRTTPMSSNGNGQNILLDIPCTVDGVRYDTHNISLAPERTYENEPDLARLSFNTRINGQRVPIPFECAYQVRDVLIKGITQFWSKVASGQCETYYSEAVISQQRFECSKEAPDQCETYDSKARISQQWVRCSKFKENDMDTWWHTGLYNNGNATFESFSRTMDAMALAITDHFRLNPIARSGNNTVYGIVWQSTVCTSFVWPWLLLPAALVLLTLLALLLIIWATTNDEERAPVWKSSILPLFYCGDLGSLREMERNADVEDAVLERTHGHGKWQIVLTERMQGELIE